MGQYKDTFRTTSSSITHAESLLSRSSEGSEFLNNQQ
jgi:hypothetical protein